MSGEFLFKYTWRKNDTDYEYDCEFPARYEGRAGTTMKITQSEFYAKAKEFGLDSDKIRSFTQTSRGEIVIHPQ